MQMEMIDTQTETSDEAQPVGMGWCPLVLGECVQGRVNGRHFLITSPIGLFSWAEFKRSERRQLSVDPPDRTKALLAVSVYLESQNLPPSGHLRVSAPVDPGQGFGTSTADIAASVRAAAAAWGRTISPEVISRIAIQIEPSDGSMYPGCVAFAHREGVLLESLGALPRFDAVVACTGGSVDTVEFDKIRRDFLYSKHDQNNLMIAWEMVRQANRTGDASLMAQAATISAGINEQLLRKPFFGEMLRFVELSGADGIMTAHTGTALALILDPAKPGYAERMVDAMNFMSGLNPNQWFHICNQRMYQHPLNQCPSQAAHHPVAAT
jgi:L-threonine kinase